MLTCVHIDDSPDLNYSILYFPINSAMVAILDQIKPEVQEAPKCLLSAILDCRVKVRYCASLGPNRQCSCMSMSRSGHWELRSDCGKVPPVRDLNRAYGGHIGLNRNLFDTHQGPITGHNCTQYEWEQFIYICVLVMKCLPYVKYRENVIWRLSAILDQKFKIPSRTGCSPVVSCDVTNACHVHPHSTDIWPWNCSHIC